MRKSPRDIELIYTRVRACEVKLLKNDIWMFSVSTRLPTAITLTTFTIVISPRFFSLSLSLSWFRCFRLRCIDTFRSVLPPSLFFFSPTLATWPHIPDRKFYPRAFVLATTATMKIWNSIWQATTKLFQRTRLLDWKRSYRNSTLIFRITRVRVSYER